MLARLLEITSRASESAVSPDSGIENDAMVPLFETSCERLLLPWLSSASWPSATRNEKLLRRRVSTPRSRHHWAGARSLRTGHRVRWIKTLCGSRKRAIAGLRTGQLRGGRSGLDHGGRSAGRAGGGASRRRGSA